MICSCISSGSSSQTLSAATRVEQEDRAFLGRAKHVELVDELELVAGHEIGALIR